MILVIPSTHNIPKNISTQYAYNIRPSHIAVAKPTTKKSNAPMMIARKTAPENRAETITPIVAAVRTTTSTPAKAKSKFRKNINKAALAEYFDNDIIQSPQEIAREKSAQWIADVVTELEHIDAIARLKRERDHQETISYFEEKFIIAEIEARDNVTYDITPAKLDIIAPAASADNSDSKSAPHSSNDAISEINNFIVDKYLRKLKHQDHVDYVQRKKKLLNKRKNKLIESIKYSYQR